MLHTLNLETALIEFSPSLAKASADWLTDTIVAIYTLNDFCIAAALAFPSVLVT